MIDLPANYDSLTPDERREVRHEYLRRQSGNCAHCGAPMRGDPTQEVTSYPIDRSSFPPTFFSNRYHLHHDHMTGLTVGVVHAECNAVLRLYHGV